jgi:large conductance mechanosensitive channel
MSILKDFEAFISRGNVIDLAVGVIIGGAFGKIVTSLVNDFIMPPIGVILGGVDFSDLKLVLKDADPVKKLPAVTLNYGEFINTVIQFLILAAVIFVMVRLLSKIHLTKAAEPKPDPAPTPSETLLTEIRDLLKSRPV